jgi:hypothetical protein
MAAAAGLDRGLLVTGDDVLVRTERVAVPATPVQLEHSGRFGAAKFGSRTEIHDRYCHGLMASAVSIRRTVEADMVSAIPAEITSVASSGPLHFDSGTPEVAGSEQANALTSARCSAVNVGGRPLRGRSLSPSIPSTVNRPRQVRTVSSVTFSRAAIVALGRPRAARRTMRARTTIR